MVYRHIPEIRPGAGALSVSVDPRFVPVITADCKLEENYKFDPSLGPLKCPVLVFYGTKDRVHAEVFFVTWGGFSWLMAMETTFSPDSPARDG